MWSPDRPPIRPPRSARSNHGYSGSNFSSLGGTPYADRSSPRYVPGSVDSKSFHTAFVENEDDDSSCDDTYVSMSSNTRQKNKDVLSTESPRILQETTRVTNTQSRRSPSLPKKISRSESFGILDKLKSDISNIDIMKNSSYADDTSTVFTGSVFDFDDENRSIAFKSITPPPNHIERSQSVDRSFRSGKEESRPSVANVKPFSDSFHSSSSSVGGRHFNVDNSKQNHRRIYSSGGASVGSYHTMERKHNELQEQLHKDKVHMLNHSMLDRNSREFDMSLSEEEKITKLQDTILGLKKEVVMEKDENERCSATLSEMKNKLEEYKLKEADTQVALREVMTNVENERTVREKEMQLASQIKESEIVMLQEKLVNLQKESSLRANELREEIVEKSRIVENLQQDIKQLKSKLDDSTKQKTDSDKILRDQIERLELRLDNEAEAHRKKIAELNEVHQSAGEEWGKKLNDKEKQIEEQNSREAEWTDELSNTRLELENLRAFSLTLENQNQYLQKSTERLQNLEQEYDELKKYKAESEITIDDLRKELEIAQNTKTALIRQVESLKESDLEREEYVSKLEDNLEELDDENKEYCVKTEHLQKDLVKAEQECEQAKTALEKSKNAIAESNIELQATMIKLEKSIHEEHVLTKRVSELESENAKLTSEVSSIEAKLKCEREEHSAKISKQEKQLNLSNDLEGKISEMQKELKSYEDKIRKLPKLEETIKELTASLVQSEDKYSTVQLKLKNANAKLDESEQNYNELNKKFVALKWQQQEIEEREKFCFSNAAKREREEMDTIHKLKTEKNNQALRIERLKDEATKSKIELAQTKEEAKKGKEQLQTALQSLDEMMKYIDCMKEESDEMMKALENETDGLMKRIGVLEKHRENDQQTIKHYQEMTIETTHQMKDKYQQKTEEELKKLRSNHEQELSDVRTRYECRIKELHSTITQRSEIAKSLQEHGSSEVSNLIKKVGEITEKHSKDLRALREKYEAEILEESSAKNSLKATLRELESKNEDLEIALKLAAAKSIQSSVSACKNCDSITKNLQEKEKAYDELKLKVHEQLNNESRLRAELAQSKQLMNITQANEKLLENHVASLEAQIDTLVADYESKLGEK